MSVAIFGLGYLPIQYYYLKVMKVSRKSEAASSIEKGWKTVFEMFFLYFPPTF